MKVSRNWLQRFFTEPLPKADELERVLTFHSSEIEEVHEYSDDVVFDVKVLPDKSAWLLSHRGVAKELSVILGVPLAHDPLATEPTLIPLTNVVTVTRHTPLCTRYAGVVIRGVTVGASPEWLCRFLESIGQRSINNVVDATNFVMFNIGQPLHAFDLNKLTHTEGTVHIGVRTAKEGESITTLTGDSHTLGGEDMLIVDETSDTPLGIAGIKGGTHAEVDAHTTDIFVESAHFDRTAVRLSSQRIKLRTDASQRFENGLVPHLAGYGVRDVAACITEIAGGVVEGYVDDSAPRTVPVPVSVTLSHLNSVLGVSLTADDVSSVLARFGYQVVVDGETYMVTPPIERDDLAIAEDVIEEIGRIYGLEHIVSVVPDSVPLSRMNARFYYAERVRTALARIGFSEVFTSSFRARDSVALANALATDKGYLRSSLGQNLIEVLDRNAPYRDLLGVTSVQVFEIGTVFPTEEREMYTCAFGVRTELAYKEKKDAPLIARAKKAVEDALACAIPWVSEGDGVVSFDIDALVATLPAPTQYELYEPATDAVYRPFSQYPFISRDIALWTPSGILGEAVRETLVAAARELLVRITLFDVFEKDGRTSYAFRLVFQSYEKTLTDADANAIMDRVASAVSERGWEVR